jgi:ABC-type multidrug transport system fused ATPase/permease subunit
MTFKWVNPIVKLSQNRQLKITDHHELPQDFDVSQTLLEFKTNYDRYKSIWVTFLLGINGKFKMILVNLIITICEIANVWALYFLTEYLKEVKDGLVAFDKRTLAFYFAVIFLSSLSLNILNIAYEFLLSREFIKIKNNLSLMVANHLLFINLNNNSETSKGNLISLIQIDCATIEFVGNDIVSASMIFLQLLFCFGVGFFLLGWAFAAFIASFILLLIATIYFKKLSMRIEKDFMHYRDQRMSLISGILSNIRFVKYNVLENYFIKLVYDSRLKEIALLWKERIIYILTMFIDSIAPAVSKTALIFTYFAINSSMKIQTFMAFMNLDTILTNAFICLPLTLHAILKLKLVFRRISTFLQLESYTINIIHEASMSVNTSEDFINGSGIQKKEREQLDKDEVMSQSVKEKPHVSSNSIEINNMSFSYFSQKVNEFEDIMKDEDNEIFHDRPHTRKNSFRSLSRADDQPENKFFAMGEGRNQQEPSNNSKLVLKALNLKIKRGELVFVIGGIGSGKSSLLYSLIGELNQISLKNQSSGARIDEEYVKIRGSISICTQKPFMLTKSIRENITFYELEDQRLLESAVKMAFLEEDISHFENGLEKEIIENGLNLSGGQRCRINLARCFYKQSDIYLLDSPFSSLDFETSKKIIEETIIKSLRGTTRVIVTNNIQFLRYADRIVLLEKGEITFSGNFSEFCQSSSSKDYQFSDNHDKLVDGFGEKDDNLSDEKKSEVVKEDKGHHTLEEKNSDNSISINFNDSGHPDELLDSDEADERNILKTFRLVFQYYGGVFFLVVFGLLCSFGNYLTYLGILNLYEMIEENKTRAGQFWKEMKVYMILNLVPAIISIVRASFFSIFALKTSKILHHRMIFEVLHGDLCRFHDKVEPARILTRFSDDFDKIDFYVWLFIDLTLLLFAFVAYEIYITMQATSVYLIGVFVLYFIVIFYYQGVYIKARKELYRLERIGNTPIINLTNQIIEGSSVIKVFKKQNEVLKELGNFLNQNTKNSLAITAITGWFDTRLIILNVLFFQLSTFMYILIFTDEKTINMKQLEILLSYLFFIILDTRVFLHFFSFAETDIVSLDRCDALLRIRPEKGYMNLSKERTDMISLDDKPSSDLLPIKHYRYDDAMIYTYEQINDYKFNKAFFFNGRIRFESVFAKYPQTTEYVSKDLSFDLLPGEKLGIIGKTGSGKSTILKLLLRYFIPKSGKIFVDGYDISKIDIKKLRSEFLVVSQEIALFEGTLRENLIYENAINKERDRKASKEGQMRTRTESSQSLLDALNENEEKESKGEQTLKELEEEVVNKLIEFGFSSHKLRQKGLDLPISCNGENLSSGEQQLISFFRVFFTKKQIILLDEATSSFDNTLQRNLMTYFISKVKGKTIISVVHKLMAITGFDKVLMLENGEVAEYGKISELLNSEQSKFKQTLEKYIKY